MLSRYMMIGIYGISIQVAIGYNDIDDSFVLSIDTSFLNEIHSKLEVAKELVSDLCYTSLTSSFSNLNYSISSDKSLFVREWGCSNTNSTVNNVVAGYVLTVGDIGILSNAKIMVVARDSNGDRINTDNGGNQPISSWCYHFVDQDANDGVIVSESINVDSVSDAETSLSRIMLNDHCGSTL